MTTIVNQEGVKYGTYVSMELVICYKCAIPFCIPESRIRNLKESRDEFYCPNGHAQAYIKSTADILKEKLEKAEQEKLTLQQNSSYWKNEFDFQVKQKEKVQRKLKRTEKRIANGVCPCCNRTFEDLTKHMKSKHPEFIETTKK